MKRIVYIFLCIISPIVFLVFIELGLRFFMPGSPPPVIRKLGEINGQSFMLFDRIGPASFFGPQAHRMSPAEIVGFYLPKPTNTLRIILVGESAMKGFPQPYAFTAASILQKMLEDTFTDRLIEVLNFSATAVASYPVLKIAEAAVLCDPDFIVVMTGHNEFFGAYGVVSTRHLGSSARWFDLDYSLRHTALAQLASRTFPHKEGRPGKQLMEMMAGMDFIATDNPIREKAFHNFSRHMNSIVNACTSANIPLILCVPPSNESDLAPIGKDDKPEGARLQFQRGKELQSAGSPGEAALAFQSARDLDTMPWRASRSMQDMIRNLGGNNGVTICDLDGAFREFGGKDGIGWNVMDDHVHPNIYGQVLMAAAMRNTLLSAIEPGQPDLADTAADMEYLKKLGDNVYDRFGVAHTMNLLFNIPFLMESNPEAKELFSQKSLAHLKEIPAELHEVIKQWTLTTDLSIGRRPLSGHAGMEWLRLNNPTAAIPLLSTAVRSVPPYSSWSMEYTYYLLATIKNLRGGLGDADSVLAEKALERGRILLTLGQASSGHTERFAGRILQLLDNHQEAIEYLLQAREKLSGMDRVANDRALIEAYQKTGQTLEADRIIKEGLEGDPAFARFYK